MAGVGDLDVAAVGQRVTHLPAQRRRGDDVVGETDHQHLGGDRPVGGQPVLGRYDRQLRAPARRPLERERGEHLQPFGDGRRVDGLGREVLQHADFRGVRRRQIRSRLGQRDIGGAEGLAGLVEAAPGSHQHGLADQFRAGEHQLLGDERAHRHRHHPGGSADGLLDQFGGVGHHLFGGESVGVLGVADAAVVEGDAAVAGIEEGRHLMDVPGAPGATGAGDEQDRVSTAAVVVRQGGHIGYLAQADQRAAARAAS